MYSIPKEERTNKPDTRWEAAFTEVREELEKASRTFGSFNSVHEGYAVMLEEVDELWDEVKKNNRSREAYRIRQEARQVAAMALRLMIDCT